MRSTRSMIRAAHTSASLRADGGVVPACESWPIATASYQTCACAPVTMPICFASRSRIGPCSICSSKYASAGNAAAGSGAAIADPVQRRAHRHALQVGQRIGLVERIHAGPHARAHQRVAEPAAFLVGPVHQFQRRLGDDAEVVQPAHHLQPGQHAERAVEFSAARLAVEMAAEQHRQAVRIAAGAAGEHVADRVDAHGQPGRLAFGAETVAAALVHVGQRQPPHAALRRGADLAPSSSGCPTAACRRCAGWSGRTCQVSPQEAAHLARRAACCKRGRPGKTGPSMRATWVLAVACCWPAAS